MKETVETPYDGVARQYDQIYGDPACRAEDEALLRILCPLMSAHGEAVLDVGCGTGWFLDYCGAWTSSYMGTDVSEGMLAELRRKHPTVATARSDMDVGWDLDFQASAVVGLWGSSSYTSPEHFMGQAAQHLRPGGLVVAMPHAGGLRHHYLPDACYDPRSGWRPWIAARAAQAARGAGLTGVRVSGFRSSPRLPSWAPAAAHRAARALQRPVPPDEATFLLVTARRP